MLQPFSPGPPSPAMQRLRAALGEHVRALMASGGSIRYYAKHWGAHRYGNTEIGRHE